MYHLYMAMEHFIHEIGWDLNISKICDISVKNAKITKNHSDKLTSLTENNMICSHICYN